MSKDTTSTTATSTPTKPEKPKSENKLAKSEQKKKDKEEAKARGVPYEQVKAERKKRQRENEKLESDEHKQDARRMRAWSKDDKDDTSDSTAANPNMQPPPAKRVRTRSMDTKEELAQAIETEASKTPEEWRKEHSISIQGHGAHRGQTDFLAPFLQFSQAPFDSRLQQALTRAGFTAPTAIQSQSWPIALTGKDMICVAKTGSGKTCGFLLPSFHRHLQALASGTTKLVRGKPVLLVLAPTRELSVQIMEEAVRFGRVVGLKSICTYGGAAKGPQIGALQRGVDMIIATPGRLNDLLEMRKADLTQIQYLVLDEADRMLDMGFEPQIRSILQHTPASRQTLLFSATWPKQIQALAQEFLKDPIQINVGELNALVANKDIQQQVVLCRDDEKYDELMNVLKEVTNDGKDKQKHPKLIVFVAKKISCNDLANRLWDDGYAVDSLHGDRPQWERTRVMTAFKSSVLRILIATDVAARGLDVKDVEMVVNYDMPTGVNGVEDYVHRIGRTGRAGNKGKAVTFFTDGDRKSATQLVQVLKKADQDVPAGLQAMVRPPRFGGGRGGGGRYGGGYGGGGGGRGYMGGGGGRGGYGRGGYGRGGGGGRGGFRR